MIQSVSKQQSVIKPQSKPRPVLGEFGKGIDGSLALSFGVSGGKNCDSRCAELLSGKCYSIVIERRHDRKQLLGKLQRHQAMGAAQVCGMAILEVQRLVDKGIVIPWFRFSTAGSLPPAGNANKLFLRQLRALVSVLIINGIPIHIPIESAEKTEFYREALAGLNVVIRESLQAEGEHLTREGAVSFRAGAEITSGKNIRARRVERARIEAKKRFELTGRKTIVCPAVVSGWKRRAGKRGELKAAAIKCGSCTACSVGHIDVVYPHH